MSNDWGQLIDYKNPKYKITFETSCNGNKFMFEEEGNDEVRKVWFTKRDWDKFKEIVDMFILDV